jgi:hypothetical protein
VQVFKPFYIVPFSLDSVKTSGVPALKSFPGRANMAHLRQSRPDSDLGFQVNVIKTFPVVPTWLGSGSGLGISGLQD